MFETNAERTQAIEQERKRIRHARENHFQLELTRLLGDQDWIGIRNLLDNDQVDLQELACGSTDFIDRETLPPPDVLAKLLEICQDIVNEKDVHNILRSFYEAEEYDGLLKEVLTAIEDNVSIYDCCNTIAYMVHLGANEEDLALATSLGFRHNRKALQEEVSISTGKAKFLDDMIAKGVVKYKR